MSEHAPNPYDYTQQTNQPEAAAVAAESTNSWGVHLPIALLALGFAVYLTAQITASQQAAKSIRWQLDNLDKRLDGMKKTREAADKRIQQVGEALKQTEPLQAQYNAFLKDVYELSKDDDDTRKALQKLGFNFTQNNPPGDTGGAKKP